MSSINIRGVEHYYEWIRQSENSHSKPVMVFVHGWGGSCRYWRTIADALVDEFDCLLYDLRGFGRSLLPNHPVDLSYELEEYADDLAILLDNLGLGEVYIHAHSMGASVAALFLNRYQERVKQCILACNGIFEYNEKAFKAFHKFGGYVVKLRYGWFLQVPLADRMFMARFLNRPIPAVERYAFLEDYLLADYEAALGTIYTSVSKKAVEVMPGEFAKLAVPTLMISGEKDIIIPAEMGRQASALNEMIEYVEIPQTGHFPMLEDKERYLNAVKRFLRVGSVVS